jgi:hypothetical protein
MAIYVLDFSPFCIGLYRKNKAAQKTAYFLPGIFACSIFFYFRIPGAASNRTY